MTSRKKGSRPKWIIYRYESDKNLSAAYTSLCRDLKYYLIYTFWYVIMSNVTAGYGRLSDSIAFFFGNFHILEHVWNVTASSNCYKLYVKLKGQAWKVNLCNHLWLCKQFWNDNIYKWYHKLLVCKHNGGLATSKNRLAHNKKFSYVRGRDGVKLLILGFCN